MKVLILAGGLGTRMREETELKPKPMVEIGGKPVLWHIMNSYSKHGVNEFIICGGYKIATIKEYFTNFYSNISDFTVHINRNTLEVEYHNSNFKEIDWKVTVLDTGNETNTGGRIKKAAGFLKNETFLCSYGDTIADVNISGLIDQHKSTNMMVTMTVSQPKSRFGVVELNTNSSVTAFREKPKLEDWINIGFFVMNYEFLDFLDQDSVLENEPLSRVAELGKLGGFKHSGFWEPMDTYREYLYLNELWDTGKAPWKN